VRITGRKTMATCRRVFEPTVKKATRQARAGTVAVGAELRVGAGLYLFPAPDSYTGEDVAEIHLCANRAVTEAFVESLLAMGLRTAEPGEFTARAYFNGKIDLAQAEAVNEIIVGSNAFQLAAAEKLLGGRLSEAIAAVRSDMMHCLSLIEAGLDFSGEDIEFITRAGAMEKLGGIRSRLEQLLAGGISCESVIDLPSVGIAGAPNAGKSSLLNNLLGTERSIVSDRGKTTRDVLSGPLALAHGRCVLFDCAGLMLEPDNILDELAQQAAIEALRNSSVVVFCVDISKAEWGRDISIRRLIEPKASIAVATKADTIPDEAAAARLMKLRELFGVEFVATSTRTGAGMGILREEIDRELTELSVGLVAGHATALKFSEAPQDSVALTARHRQAVIEGIGNVNECVDEIKAGNEEVAAMILRAAYQAISDIEQQHVDEQILERIFCSFCIGK
jgi:tRNA modification GTPase